MSSRYRLDRRPAARRLGGASPPTRASACGQASSGRQLGSGPRPGPPRSYGTPLLAHPGIVHRYAAAFLQHRPVRIVLRRHLLQPTGTRPPGTRSFLHLPAAVLHLSTSLCRSRTCDTSPSSQKPPYAPTLMIPSSLNRAVFIGRFPSTTDSARFRRTSGTQVTATQRQLSPAPHRSNDTPRHFEYYPAF